MSDFSVLDLFSAAAGGWSLGMHRAGFQTVAACEFIDWRRALYAQNNPGVLIYDDVRTLTADRIISDIGYFPRIVVGSPPCQDISSANTKGKGVDGERSGLYFEAIRIVREARERCCGPDWIALENSSNLRTRGADRVIQALEAIGYTVWAFVVGADDVGANHERKRSWLVAFNAAQIGHGGGRPWRRGADGNGAAYSGRSFVGFVPDADEARRQDGQVVARIRPAQVADDGRDAGRGDEIADADANGFRWEDRRGRNWLRLDVRVPKSVGGAPQGYGFSDAEGDGRAAGRQGRFVEPDAQLRVEAFGSDCGEMGGGKMDGGDAGDPWPQWNGGFANHLRVDARLSARVADTRIILGAGKGTSAASLIVEAFGDSVCPQIPEAIGRAILRTERAMSIAMGAA